MFEFLFQYAPLVFRKGEFTLAYPVPGLLAALLAAAALAAWATRPAGGRRERLLLAGLRWSALALLLFALFRPALRVSTVVPRQNFLGVLLDDSRSMRIADLDGRSRADVARFAFGGAARASREEGAEGPAAVDPEPGGLPGPAGELRRALEERFRLRFFRFSDLPARVRGPEELSLLGNRTDLAAALEGASQELAGLPLSGLLLVTDGAHNGPGSLEETILALRGAGIPVYTVGLGRPELVPDVELQRVEVPRRVPRGSTVVAEAVLSHRGAGGRRVRVQVEDEGRILASAEVSLARGKEATSVELSFAAEEAGARRLRFRVLPFEGELLDGNNARQLLLEVRPERRRILHFEGEPRYEIKFLRRAMEGDAEIQVVTLLRSAEEKFLRLGVEGSDELAAGFPRTREELFAYEGLILGSVEASFFTHDQLRMLAEYVSRRGGGLLVLGGARSLAEGGYAGTPLAEALPVRLEGGPAPEDGSPEVVTLRPSLTPAGRHHPVLRLAAEGKAGAARWDSLPPLTSPNRVGAVKAGAVTLLAGETETGERRPLLVFQRFGRGVSTALVAQDVWLWQMHAAIPLEDETHETLWRQLLRWLVSGVPGRVEASVAVERPAPGEPVRLRADVADERFLRVNRADVTARVVGPTGLETELPMEWVVTRDGSYEATFRPEEEGLHRVRVEATLPDGGTVSGETYFEAAPPEVEAFDAERNDTLLREIARRTGGRYYNLDRLEALPREVVYTEAGDTVVETLPLWDMPILFFLLVAVLGAEWGFRRLRGLP